MPQYLAILLLTLVVVLMLALHLVIVFWALRRSFNWFTIHTAVVSDQANPHGTTAGLSREDVEKLPCYNFKNGDGSDGQEDDRAGNGSVICAVCLESFRPGEKCRLLPQCKHSFHAACVDSWLIKCSLCPICRGGVELMKGRDHVVIGISESSSSSTFGHT
ncbi:hypothetical protein LUZ60_000169 [Juncus effusus]|nr:hypothetical protein LUZ60_000169 [Juncus effusus]